MGGGVRRECQVDKCAGDIFGHQYCNMHYKRWRKSGDPGPAAAVRGQPLGERIKHASHLDPGSDCMLWARSLSPDGYGRIKVNGQKVMAHRAAWLVAYGPIPNGMEVDHECGIRHCVRAKHLRLATRKQNNQALHGLHSKNTSGFRGVHWNSGAWVAAWNENGQQCRARFSDKLTAAAHAAAKRLENYEFQSSADVELVNSYYNEVGREALLDYIGWEAK